MKTHNKLVRDLIPGIIQQSGRTAEWETLDEAAYQTALRTKLTEEAREFEQDPCAEELADLMEVMEAIIQSYGYDVNDILRIKADKKAQRGGFDKRIFLRSVL